VFQSNDTFILDDAEVLAVEQSNFKDGSHLVQFALRRSDGSIFGPVWASEKALGSWAPQVGQLVTVQIRVKAKAAKTPGQAYVSRTLVALLSAAGTGI
jgi:hypothetical protein